MTLQGRRLLSYTKSNWKKAIAKIQSKADDFLAEAHVGTRVGMGAVYSIAHRIQELGEQAEPLSRRAAELGMEEKVKKEIAYLARVLSVYSSMLLQEAEKAGLPTRTFPLFVTSLELVVPQEAVCTPEDRLRAILDVTGEEND